MKKKVEELRQTDSLRTAFDSVEIKFMSFDTTRIYNILDSTGHNVELLKKFAPDSLDKETTILLANYLYVHRLLVKYPPDRKNIFLQISFSRKQLENMKHDLNDGAMNREDFIKNIPEEEKAITELNSYISMTSSKANLLIAQYDFIKLKVDSFITTLDTLHEPLNRNKDLNQMNFDKD